MNSSQSIVLYTHTGCPGGNRAMNYFHEHGIPVEIKDIGSDPKAFEEFQRHGCFATPVIIIGRRKFVGFDEEEIAQALAEDLKP